MAADWTIEYLEHRELSVFDKRGNPESRVRVIYKVGPFGPFTLEWAKADYSPALLSQAVEAKRAELRSLPS